MAEQGGGLNRGGVSVRTVVGLSWLALSTALYSIPCMLFGPLIPRLAYAIGRIWSRHLLAVLGVRVTVRGLDKLDSRGRYVFVSNHQSHLDIPTLLAFLPYRLTFIAKRELFLIPLFGWAIALMGHIAVDRGSARRARRSFDRAVCRLRKESISLVVFPEGTRSPDGEVKEFKRGSFALALESGLQVIPLSIHGTRNVWPKGALRLQAGPVTLNLGSAIDPGALLAAGTLSAKEHLADLARNAVVQMHALRGS